MGLSKGSRKGKKAWRRNISTSKVEEAVARHSTDERKGLDLSGVDDNQLFFVDKSHDEKSAATGKVSKKQKRAPKLLKCQAILQGAHQARPVEGITKRNRKGGPGKKAHMLGQTAEQSLVKPQPTPNEEEGVVDLWGEPESGPEGGWGTSIKVTGSKQPTLRGRASKTSRERSLPSVAAVEVDAPGCSYNPDAEQHQDVVAEAVAVEMYKALRSEMAPKGPPAYAPDGMGPVDELYSLQVDEEIELDSEGGGEGEEEEKGARRAEKKSRSKRNREAAVRAAEKLLEERRRLKKQRHELSHLKQLNAEIETETAEQQRLRLRREANESERARSRTPRLGKTPFVNGAIQVLASDEIFHNLRRLKSHPMMLKDRFLSMQQRGTIETRRIAQLQKKKKREVEYDNRASAAKAEAGRDEILAMTRERKKMAKKLKRAAAK